MTYNLVTSESKNAFEMMEGDLIRLFLFHFYALEILAKHLDRNFAVLVPACRKQILPIVYMHFSVCVSVCARSCVSVCVCVFMHV